jgi:hypothetical protein
MPILKNTIVTMAEYRATVFLLEWSMTKEYFGDALL